MASERLTKPPMDWNKPVESVERFKVGGWMLIERLLRLCIHPRLRARCLRWLGADIGRNVRVYEVMLINPFQGFRHLRIGHDSAIGAGTVIDLTGRVVIGSHTAIGPGCMLLTHSDPGSRIGSRLCAIYPRTITDIRIGDHAWLGAQTLVLGGVEIGDGAVVGAGSLVTRSVPKGMLAYGRPASAVRKLEEVPST
jgi:acetyltransferase-like isoleucine patch superfamily enzyme